MEIKWLEDFIALGNTFSFTRSAEMRHVTQSAFSRRIRRLEAWLGVALIDRASYPPRLSPAGQSFLPTAQEALRLLHQARSEFRHQGGPHARTITFTALHTLSLTFFPHWLRQAETRFGALQSRLCADRGSMEANVGSLTEGECDFLLTYAHPAVPFLLDPSRFEARLLGEERVIPVSAPDPSGQPLHVVGSSKQAVRYLGYSPNSFFGIGLANLFEERALNRLTVHENTMSAGLKAMAMAGWGLAWIPQSLIATELAEGTLVRACDPSWDLIVEIRLYRCLANQRAIVNRFWSFTMEPEAMEP